MNTQINLYFDFRGARIEAGQLIASILHGTIDERTGDIRTLTSRYVVMNNPCFNIEQAREFDGVFFYYKYYFEVEPIVEVTDENLAAIKQELSEMLVAIWKQNIPAIVSADFEDELPEKGGYMSPNVPIPK